MDRRESIYLECFPLSRPPCTNFIKIRDFITQKLSSGSGSTTTSKTNSEEDSQVLYKNFVSDGSLNPEEMSEEITGGSSNSMSDNSMELLIAGNAENNANTAEFDDFEDGGADGSGSTEISEQEFDIIGEADAFDEQMLEDCLEEEENQADKNSEGGTSGDNEGVEIEETVAQFSDGAEGGAGGNNAEGCDGHGSESDDEDNDDDEDDDDDHEEADDEHDDAEVEEDDMNNNAIEIFNDIPNENFEDDHNHEIVNFQLENEDDDNLDAEDWQDENDDFDIDLEDLEMAEMIAEEMTAGNDLNNDNDNNNFIEVNEELMDFNDYDYDSDDLDLIEAGNSVYSHALGLLSDLVSDNEDDDDNDDQSEGNAGIRVEDDHLADVGFHRGEIGGSYGGDQGDQTGEDDRDIDNEEHAISTTTIGLNQRLSYENHAYYRNTHYSLVQERTWNDTNNESQDHEDVREEEYEMFSIESEEHKWED